MHDGQNLFDPETGYGAFDFDKLAETVRLAVRQLDRVIDLNFYPIESARRGNLRWRPVGLGVMGLQDVFFRLRLPFDSEPARALSALACRAAVSASLPSRGRTIKVAATTSRLSSTAATISRYSPPPVLNGRTGEGSLRAPSMAVSAPASAVRPAYGASAGWCE